MRIFPLRRVLLAAMLCCWPLLARAQGADLDSILGRAQAEQSSGSYAQAAADYAQATALDPDDAELWANRGLMEHLAGEFPQAIASFKKALARKPALFTPKLFLGVDYLETSQPGLALPYLKRAHAARPKDPEAAVSLGRAYAATHQPRAAAAAYSSAVELKADAPGAWYGLGVSSLALIETDGAALAKHAGGSAWASALYADELLTQGRTAEALHLYTVAAAGATAAERATLAAMLAHAQTSDATALPQATYAQLETTVGPASQPCPVSQPAARASKGAPASAAQLHREAACAFFAGQYGESADAAARALGRSPGDAEALYWSVKANERRAVAALSRFEELAPQSPATFDLVGDLYRRQREPDQAGAEYKKALAIHPHDPAGLLGLAAAQFAQGHPSETTETLRVALADRPNDTKLNLLMGQALVEQHSFAEARPFLEKSIAEGGDMQPLAHALLGRVDAEQGRTAEAIEQMQLGLASDEDGSLNFQLSRLYRKAGDKEASQRAEAQAKALEANRLANAKVAVDSLGPQ